MSQSSEAPAPDPGVPASFWRSLGRRLASFFGWCARPCTRFCSLAWRGAALGLIAAALFFPAYAGLYMGTGLGTAVDVAGVLLLGIVVLGLATLILWFVLALTKRMALRFKALVVVAFGSLIAVAEPFGFSPGFALRLGGWLIVLPMLAGASIGILRHWRARRAGIVSALIALLLLAVTVTVGTVAIHRLTSPGADPYLKEIHAAADRQTPALDAPDPSQAGPYQVTTLFYGSGTDRRRPEYAQNADLRTEPVDASALLTNLNGFKAWARRQYWGFDPKSFPLNARVWLPRGEGLFPLVLIVHGNHKMEEFADPGYAYLGELLASRGFMVASVDENFLNFSWSGDIGSENHVRGWLLLKHLQLWRTWNDQPENPFHDKVDLGRIALIGHSRGGEAIVHAAAFNRLLYYPDNTKVSFDFGFAIKTLIAIAPIDGQYEPVGLPTPIENVNYLVLHGSHDSDVDFFAGARTYRRVKFTDRNYWMKAALYIHRANHGQFNTVWGPYDAGPPLKHLLARGALLRPEEQRKIAQVYIAAFLEATLCGKSEYVPLFRDHRRAARWLPETVYFHRFADSRLRMASDFDGSIDVTRTTVEGGFQTGANLGLWRHRRLEGRNGWSFQDRAAVLGWNTTGWANLAPDHAPNYTITLPDDLATRWLLDRQTILSFCLADTCDTCEAQKEENPVQPPEPNAPPAGAPNAPAPGPGRPPIDLTIELVASDGAVARLPLSHVRPLQPVLKVTFTKWPYWERVRFKSATEPVLQTYEMPLSDFVAANPAFDPGRLKQIRFRFDHTRTAVILLDDVGLIPGPAAIQN
jgi:dienelactone hydrolase